MTRERNMFCVLSRTASKCLKSFAENELRSGGLGHDLQIHREGREEEFYFLLQEDLKPYHKQHWSSVGIVWEQFAQFVEQKFLLRDGG